MKIFETKESIAVFSDRSDGDLSFFNLTDEDFENTWKKLTKDLSVKPSLPLYVNQVHKDNIVQVAKDQPIPSIRTYADALITNLPQTAIGVYTADCCPVLISGKKVVSATHAGWKSTLQSIGYKTVLKYIELYGIKPSDLTAWIGPCIDICCFELGDEVYDLFVSENSEWKKFFTRKDKWHLDLRGLNRYQLLQAGIPDNQIIDYDECTYCMPEKYFSYRRMKKRNGSMFSFIYLK
ncbi:MAG: peptidoglycan editing factor PgeF [Candidatus Riflebacteria bacterium]|nr:peptidoglycan editing factor PgeF [Candidatus Riflebacteria bacterium]